MEVNPSPAPFSTKNVHSRSEYINIIRRTITYHASAWGDYFLTHTSDFKELCSHQKEELQRQKEEVKKLLVATPDSSWNKMDLIDAIQRLGVGSIFQEEINKFLIDTYKSYPKCNGHEDHDLRMVATRFRLLREHGFHVSCDVFKKFKDHECKFQESLVNNIEGMVSLYEAAQFRVHGEDILEEALQFCSTHLKTFVQNKTTNPVAARVDEALKMPIHKTPLIVGVKKFMSSYQEDESHIEVVLLKLAKREFNELQKKYQNELREIARWWKALDFKSKLPFARDRMVECYFWILGIYLEPQYHLGRKILSKVIAMASVADDIYDVYGTLDELELLTDAIQKFNENALNQLPPYMRHHYQALLDVYAEAEEELDKIGKSYFVWYAKEEMKKLSRAYYQEAKWMYSKHIPGMEEYMKVAVVSSGYMMVATTCLLGMGNLVTKEDFEWVSSEPVIVKAASTIARLMDDMAGCGFERKISAVESYMNENSATKEEAFDELQKQVSVAWTDINQECLHPTEVALPILMLVANSARVIHLLYKDGDGYTNSKTMTKDLIKSILSEPMPL